jgi:sigma54-dependent transcription regulator
MHATAKRSAMQGLSQKRSVRAVVFDYGNVLCLEQTLELRAVEEKTVLPLGSDEEAQQRFSGYRKNESGLVRRVAKEDFGKTF